jgi:hypothetical protein
MSADDEPTLRDLRRCFDGRIPAVIATADANGVPNVTYLTSVHPVDGERVALSNQFFSKTGRNLAVNPRASLLLLDPITYDEFRLAIRYERTERRGPVFERLRDDVDRAAALSGMSDVFRLRSADIYRVEHIERCYRSPFTDRGSRFGMGAVAELTARLSRCADLDTAVSAAVAGLDELLGYRHSAFLLLDETGTRLFTIASHGFDAAGIGSEVTIGDGVAGLAAERCAPVRVGHLRQIGKYSRTVRRSFEAGGHVGPGFDIAVPELVDVESRLAVPAQSRGQLVGVLLVESSLPVAFDEDDEAALAMVASLLATMVEIDRAIDEPADRISADGRADHAVDDTTVGTHVRFFGVDGSVFLDGDYLIRGVAGRILWSLCTQHEREDRVDFTTKEIRLDASLDLPGFRDNLDTRLILLKRRLEERDAPIRLHKTGRGRYTLEVRTRLRLDAQG